ncbi:uncharacterized protein LOC121432200 [Lytechinus variegatus]|uniref:uncharacterized protein LOC121432200 n=1 Tax=Lytechinus variegatus TaxID=7654 RepID=UPI001BB24D35|nr:uncharacterized protein LOC121432200 [Lytechinus variegatus]
MRGRVCLCGYKDEGCVSEDERVKYEAHGNRETLQYRSLTEDSVISCAVIYSSAASICLSAHGIEYFATCFPNSKVEKSQKSDITRSFDANLLIGYTDKDVELTFKCHYRTSRDTEVLTDEWHVEPVGSYDDCMKLWLDKAYGTPCSTASVFPFCENEMLTMMAFRSCFDWINRKSLQEGALPKKMAFPLQQTLQPPAFD